MRPIVITMAPTALDRDGIALSQTPSGAGAVTLNGTLVSGGVATMGAVSAVGIYSASNISNRTFTITGTDHYDFPISETGLTGPNNGTIVSAKSYKTVTAMTISGAAAGAIEVGPTGAGISRAVPLDRNNQAGFQVGLGLTISGTVSATVQHTFDDPFASTFDPYTATWHDHEDLATETATVDGNYAYPPSAVRLKIVSSASGTATLTIIQQG